jgi:ribosomal-protein-alanine N-acetyltransferase
MIAAPDIELARPADARAIAALSRVAIEHGLRSAWTEARVRRAIADRATNVLVARRGGAVIGFALLHYVDDAAHLLLLGVAAEHRRQGVASALIAWLDETLRVAGILRIQVEVRAGNDVALAFYARLGFEKVAVTRGYYQGVEDAVHLVRELRPAG